MTPEEIQAIRQKYKYDPANLSTGVANQVKDVNSRLALIRGEEVKEEPQVQPQQSFLEALTSPKADQNLTKAQGADVGLGVVKGVGETALTLGTGLQNIGQSVTGESSGLSVLDSKTEENIAAKKTLQANTPEEAVGKGAERVVEFFVPGALGVKAPATANFLTKALVEGLGTSAVSTAQSGSFEDGLKTGLLAGGISAVGGGAKAGLNYFGVPEKLYNTIFKSNAPSMVQELRSEGIKNLQKTNPDQFASLVKDGVVKVSKDGTTQVNESLAKQALDRGLKGSIENMSNGVVMNLLTNEQKAQKIAKTSRAAIKTPEKQFANVFGEIAQDYENVGFGDTAQRAKELSSVFATGKVTPKDALDARRLLDGLRIRSSFVPDTKLSTSQENLKFLADQTA